MTTIDIGINTEDRLEVAEGLKALLAREAGRHLASMGGSQKDIAVPPRRRPTFPPRRPAQQRPGPRSVARAKQI